MSLDHEEILSGTIFQKISGFYSTQINNAMEFPIQLEDTVVSILNGAVTTIGFIPIGIFKMI